MLEFGSDFHWLEGFVSETRLLDYFGEYVLLADGRQAIELLIRENGWKRIWMPEYFCYDVLDSIKRSGIEIAFYEDLPENDESISIKSIKFKDGDVLLRMNYFGLRGWRDSSAIGAPVIEDHSHCPVGHWARSSNADWCIASLRKTLPIAEGGVVWSPKGIPLLSAPKLTLANRQLAETRWQAMREKSAFLKGVTSDKDSFRQKYLSSEDGFDKLAISLIDEESRKVLERFDYNQWFKRKQENWLILSAINSEKFRVLNSESEDNFSFTILCDRSETRDRLRKRLIDSRVYPAILWPLPDNVSTKARDISERMLSIHCDARYTIEDITILKSIIENAERDV